MKLLVQSSGLVVLLASTVSAQVTQRVSVGGNGAQANSSSLVPSISADGRFVVFQSLASNLVPGDTSNAYDIFVRDRQTGATERVSVDSAGVQANSSSNFASISADGRFVAFVSSATNLVPGDVNGVDDVFFRDRPNGTTELVSVSSGGTQANGPSGTSSISADGRYVVFASLASNLVPNDTNDDFDCFLRDRQNGTTECVSVDSNGAQGNSESNNPVITPDGRYVAFWSDSDNLAPGDFGFWYDVFVRDLLLGTTERVSLDTTGAQGNFDSVFPAITPDGRYVAFQSAASNLVPGDTNTNWDAFVHDRQLATIERVSISSGGAQGNAASTTAKISDDGRYVAFESFATNLVSADTNFAKDVFVRDRDGETTRRMSLNWEGVQGNQFSTEVSISGDGRYVAFRSVASNLVPGDTNGDLDVFVRDRVGGPEFTSVCDPGIDGVITCPCGNPPVGPGRGCDNSSATGGAALSASGGTYLSSDSLVFTTSGEKPTALSIVSQWTGPNAAGVVLGMGVRCTSGSLKRLYTKSAVGGSITAPALGAGDPQVSVRSASLGNAIFAGESRWYYVYYRDPIVLGGCPAISTFNATQTGRVVWSP